MVRGGQSCIEAKVAAADAVVVDYNLSAAGDSCWGLGAARDLDRWGLFLIRSQGWSLRLDTQGWFLGHRSQAGGLPVAVNWHPEVPGRPAGLVGSWVVAVVCEMEV